MRKTDFCIFPDSVESPKMKKSNMIFKKMWLYVPVPLHYIYINDSKKVLFVNKKPTWCFHHSLLRLSRNIQNTFNHSYTGAVQNKFLIKYCLFIDIFYLSQKIWKLSIDYKRS